MDNQKSAPEKDRLPRTVCAFAAFFTFAVPALALAVGIASHPMLVELASRAEQSGIHESFPVVFLDWHRPIAWAIFAIAAVLSAWTFGLICRNNTAGSLFGGGRIVFSLGLTGMLSAFYLCALLVAATRLLIPFLLR